MDKEYLKGFYVKKKQSQYGHFYKCSLKYADFINALKPNDQGYVNFCIFENSEGKPYAVIDNYKADNKADNEVKTFGDDDELPF